MNKLFTNIKRMFALLVVLVMTFSFMPINVFASSDAKLNKQSVTIVTGATYTLRVQDSNSTVKWSTTDRDIAGITTKGRIIARDPGTAYIYAKVDGKTLKCKVKVVAGTVKFDKSSYSLTAGENSQIVATVKGTKKVGVTNSNSKVAKVKASKWKGNKLYLKVTPLKEGTTKVKVYLKSDKSIYKTVTIKVKDKVTNNNTGTGNTDISQNTNTDTGTSTGTSGMSYAEQVLYYVNIEREKAGVSPLTLDSTLCNAADIRAKEIVGTFSHDRPDGSSCFSVLDGTSFANSYKGENIAAGYSSAKDTVDQWMDSSGHKANILNSNYKYLGVGFCSDSSAAYKYYWVQLFAG